jgi:hypothetical protein
MWKEGRRQIQFVGRSKSRKLYVNNYQGFYDKVLPIPGEATTLN